MCFWLFPIFIYLLIFYYIFIYLFYDWLEVCNIICLVRRSLFVRKKSPWYNCTCQLRVKHQGRLTYLLVRKWLLIWIRYKYRCFVRRRSLIRRRLLISCRYYRLFLDTSCWSDVSTIVYFWRQVVDLKIIADLNLIRPVLRLKVIIVIGRLLVRSRYYSVCLGDSYRPEDHCWYVFDNINSSSKDG